MPERGALLAEGSFMPAKRPCLKLLPSGLSQFQQSPCSCDPKSKWPLSDWRGSGDEILATSEHLQSTQATSCQGRKPHKHTHTHPNKKEACANNFRNRFCKLSACLLKKETRSGRKGLRKPFVQAISHLDGWLL